MDYSYPLDLDWSQEEMIAVVEFLSAIEDAYERKVDSKLFKEKYDAFKKVCPGKSDENNIYKEFKKASGYDGYPVVQELKNQLKDNQLTTISMKSY